MAISYPTDESSVHQDAAAVKRYSPPAGPVGSPDRPLEGLLQPWVDSHAPRTMGARVTDIWGERFYQPVVPCQAHEISATGNAVCRDEQP